MVEGNQENGVIPFLDTLVQPEADNSLTIKMYYKPTHTDQYLQWDSHHNHSAKYSVIGTLTHMTKTVCTILGLLNEELQYFKEALVRCKYPRWAINKVQNKVINGNWEDNGTSHVGNTTQDTIPPAVTTKYPPPPGKTQYGTHSYPICSRPGRQHQRHLHQVWDSYILQR